MPTTPLQHDIRRSDVVASDTQAVVLSNEWVNDEYKHMVLKAEGTASHAQPGQFFNILCPSKETVTPFFRRPMSTYNANPITGKVEFLYKVAGAGTHALSQLNEGQLLNILGPLGKGFELQPDWQHIIIVARGVGLATLAPLATAAHALHIDITVLLSARSAQALLKPSQQRFAQLGAEVITARDDDGSSHPEAIERSLRTVLNRGQTNAVFTCGSKRLTALLKRLATDYGITGQVAMEEQMVCGLGMCQCCVKVFEKEGTYISKRVCVEGPVFDLAEVMT